jgi:putative membrane protein
VPTLIQRVCESWEFPVWPTLALVLMGLVYLRGWLRLRSADLKGIPAWRVASFLSGLFLIWVALGSPLAAYDEQSLTVHMVQHLLLMTLAPPFIWLSVPLIPLLHGLPRAFVQRVVGPLLRSTPVKWIGGVLAQPAFCWFAAAAALVGWHVPAAFTLALRSESWHVVEHVSFLTAGVLFWWPVVQPWPSAAKSLRWPILLYLFLATLPCDILSGFLVFSERIVYPVYLSASQQTSVSVLTDQECAGALMWTSVTIIYLVASALIATHLLLPRNFAEGKLVPSELRDGRMQETDGQRAQVA